MPRTILRTISGLAILLAVLIPTVASAATSTWTGGGSNNSWSPQANWGTSTLPTTSGTYSLQFGGTSRTNTINNIGTISVNSLSFTNNGGSGQNAFFTITGGTLAFNNSSIVTTTATGGVFTNNSNGDTISSAMTLSGTSTFTTANLHNLSLLGNMSGSGAVVYTESNANTTDYVYVGGSNSYSGGTVIQGGGVQTGARTPGTTASNNYAFGSGSVTIRDTGTLFLRNSSVVTNDITVSGTGQDGSAIKGSFGAAAQTAELQGRVTLAGDVQFTTASSGAADTTSKLLVSGPVDLGVNTLTLRPGVRSGETVGLLIQVTGSVSGSGGVIINGADGGSRVLMSGNNSYSGGTTISTGTLQVGSNSALGTGFLAITPSGTGILDLNGQALQVGALSGNSTAIIESNSGAASLTTTSTSNTTYAGTIRNGSGTVGLTKAGSGIFTLSGSNSNTGTTNVNGGVLALGNANALAGGGTITFGGGTLQYSASNTQDYSSRITTSGSAIAIDTNGQSVTFASVIDSSNTGGLTKQGAGTLFVNGVNTYTGNTVVEAGTLGGNGTIAGLVTVGTSAFISPGSAANTTGVLSVGSLDLTPGGAAVMAISGTGASSYDQIVASSLVSFSNGILNINFTQGGFQNYDFWQLFSGSSFSGDLSQVNLSGSYAGTFVNLLNGEWKADLGGGQSLSFYETDHLLNGVGLAGQLVLVPEPSTLIIAGIGIVVTGWQSLSRRRRLALLRQALIANDQLAA